MPREEMYRQCRMRRGEAVTTGWIPERGAKVGAEVELLTGDGEFWKVEAVFDPPLTESALRAKQTADRNSLPSIAGKG